MTTASGSLGRIATALTCAAIEPRLSGVLLVGLPPDLLEPIADWFCELWGEVVGTPDLPETPDTLRLGAATTEDDLWLDTTLREEDHRLAVSLGPGPLAESAGTKPLVVRVPDLAQLSLAGMRAAACTLTADVAYVERHGVSTLWTPRAKWLAACDQRDVAGISRHLLDRFMLRVDASDVSALAAYDRVLRFLPDGNVVGWLPFSDPSLYLPRRSRAAAHPQITREAARRAVSLLGPAPHSIRREFGLALTARALARIDGAAEVTSTHMERAALLLSLGDGEPAPAEASQSVDAPARPVPARTAPQPGRARRKGLDMVSAIFYGDELQPLDEVVGADLDERQILYPDDVADDQPAQTSQLRAPWQGYTRSAGPRGPVIGLRPARDPRDIAICASLIEAAKFQPTRRAAAAAANRTVPAFHVLASDLRGYLRSPTPVNMLVLVLDHTCRKGWEWTKALAAYLRWAYVARASVCVVEVGGAAAIDELRAQWYLARSVLDPRIPASLTRSPGRATPLAHGLQLAADALNRVIHQGRAILDDAWLVIVSDGRGNVPLAVSTTDRPRAQVGAEGVRDALEVAEVIRKLNRVHSVVVDTAPSLYADLPHQLARALGGQVVAGRKRFVFPHVDREIPAQTPEATVRASDGG